MLIAAIEGAAVVVAFLALGRFLGHPARDAPERSSETRAVRRMLERDDGPPEQAAPRPRQAKAVGLIGFAAAVALPVLLWREAMARWPTGLPPQPGLLGHRLDAVRADRDRPILFVPVVPLDRPAARTTPAYPRNRNAYAGWAITLYLLGVALASQVATIAHGLGTP